MDDATLQDVVNSVDNLYVSVSDQTIATMEIGNLVWSNTEMVKGVYSSAVVIAFFVCFAVGWFIWGRQRPRGGLLK